MPNPEARRRMTFSPRAALRLLAVAAVVAVLAAAPLASAATYIVTLDNGNIFESRYQPREASWDADMVMVLTEYGNWIALERTSIAEVTTDIEAAGFGTVIDSKTVSLGILANDLPEPSEETEPSNREILEQFLNQPTPDYSVQQFVDPAQAGGGLPVGFSQQSQPPVVLNGGN